jgi:phytoene dehydrogenase-like protein
MGRVTIVGGGLAGLVAAVTCAEGGARVQVFEAHEELGGRARTARGPYKANLGPHALYTGGATWRWLTDRDLLPRVCRPAVVGLRFRRGGTIHRIPPAGVPAALVRYRRREAPVNTDFRSWAAATAGEATAAALSSAAGVFCFHHDPGELSARFVWERLVRVTALPPTARFIRRGWGTLIDGLAERARALGVAIETGAPIDALPEPPLIVAMEPAQARRLLGNEALRWPSGHTVCVDVGVRSRRSDPYIVSDLDEAGWVERFSAPDPSLAPDGHELVQAQLGPQPGESVEATSARLEAIFDAAFPAWRERATWRRRQVMDARTGALDPPGTTWRDRPAIDRGDGVFLAGDWVAAPGLLSEVSVNSAIRAGELALEAADAGSARRVTATRAA